MRGRHRGLHHHQAVPEVAEAAVQPREEDHHQVHHHDRLQQGAHRALRPQGLRV